MQRPLVANCKARYWPFETNFILPLSLKNEQSSINFYCHWSSVHILLRWNAVILNRKRKCCKNYVALKQVFVKN